jgi:cell division septation protein DedD
VPARARPLIAVAAAAVALAGCSWTEATDDDASPTRTPPAPDAVRDTPVIGTLPPITVPGALPVAPPGAADDSAPLPDGAGVPAAQPPPTEPPPTEPPPTAAPAPPPRPAPTAAPATAAPSPASGAPAGVQAGSFSVRDGAARLQDQLRAAGFDGFALQGEGPFRVIRGGLPEPDARALRDRLTAAGFEAFVVRS